MKAKFKSGRVIMILLLATLLTTELTFSQIIEITKPYENKDKVYLLELNDSSLVQFDKAGATFDSLTNRYKGRTIEFLDTAYPKEKVRMAITLSDLLSGKEIQSITADLKRYDKSDYSFIYESQYDSIYISPLKINSIRNKTHQFHSIHMMNIEKIGFDISKGVDTKVVVKEKSLLYHFDANVFFSSIGMNLMLNIDGLNLGLRYNMLDNLGYDYGVSSIEYGLMSGFVISEKYGFWEFNGGISLNQIKTNQETQGTQTVRRHTYPTEVGWAVLFCRDPSHWSNVSEKYNYYQKKETFSIGLPLEIKYIFKLSDNLGLGISAYMNINPVKTYGGLSLTFSFGKFGKRDLY